MKNAIKRRHGNQIGLNIFKNMGQRVFKALMGKTARVDREK